MPDTNRRRNQIVAERTIDKKRREGDWSRFSDRQLWSMVDECIASAIHTRKYLGQPGKAAEAVLAEGAVRELKLRGTQLQLPV